MCSLVVGETLPRPTLPLDAIVIPGVPEELKVVVPKVMQGSSSSFSTNNLSSSAAIFSSSGMATCSSHHHQLIASQKVAFWSFWRSARTWKASAVTFHPTHTLSSGPGSHSW